MSSLQPTLTLPNFDVTVTTPRGVAEGCLLSYGGRTGRFYIITYYVDIITYYVHNNLLSTHNNLLCLHNNLLCLHNNLLSR